MQNLPGVARVPYGLGFLVVRGCKPWDTRTYVDDALVPLLFHFGGLYATFNSSLLENLSFQPGNFGADYGRNIGGLVTADVRTPSQSGYHGYVDVNLIDASALFEGHLTEDWSFAVSGRRSLHRRALAAGVRPHRAQREGRAQLHRRAPLLRLPGAAGAQAEERGALLRRALRRRRQAALRAAQPRLRPGGPGRLRHLHLVQPAAPSASTRR